MALWLTTKSPAVKRFKNHYYCWEEGQFTIDRRLTTTFKTYHPPLPVTIIEKKLCELEQSPSHQAGLANISFGTRFSGSCVPSLGVIMPVFNEARTVALISGKVLALENVQELIIVDDCSTDESWNAISKLTRDPRIKACRHERNRGKGAAVRTGFGMATATVLVVQDADMEYNPDDLKLMLEAMESEDADVVYGSRFAKEACPGTTWWHQAGNRTLTLITNLITGLRLTDEATCYKMFRRKLLASFELQEERFGFCPEFTTKVSQLGIRIVEVPIRYRARSRAEGKKIRLRDGVSALRCLVQYGLLRRIRTALRIGLKQR